MTRRVVGILGGMGPEATILLQQRVLAAVQAGDDSDHLPLYPPFANAGIEPRGQIHVQYLAKAIDIPW